MRTRHPLLALILCATASATAIACDQPADIAIPDGRNASEDQIRAASAAYKEFMKGMKSYQACLEVEANALRASQDGWTKDQIKNAEDEYADRQNNASARMATTTDALNDAIAEYKARRE